MITKIYSTSIIVRDQERALDFYVNTLGFRKVDDAEFGEGQRWLVVVPGNAETGLTLSLPTDVGQGEEAIGKDSGIAFVTNDIDKTYAELSAKGVKFTGPPEQMPWGDKATSFSDPDGNSFFLSADHQ